VKPKPPPKYQPGPTKEQLAIEAAKAAHRQAAAARQADPRRVLLVMVWVTGYKMASTISNGVGYRVQGPCRCHDIMLRLQPVALLCICKPYFMSCLALTAANRREKRCFSYITALRLLFCYQLLR
jgi:hypothetical protein